MAEENFINMEATEPAAEAESPAFAESEDSTGGTVDDNTIFGSDEEVFDLDGNLVEKGEEKETEEDSSKEKKQESEAESRQEKADNPSAAEYRFRTNGKEVVVDDKSFTDLAASMGFTKEELTEKIQLGGKDWAKETERAVKGSPYYNALQKIAQWRGIAPEDLAREIGERSGTLILNDTAAKVKEEYRAAGKQIDNETALEIAKGRLVIDANRKAEQKKNEQRQKIALEAEEQQRKLEPLVRFREKYPGVKGKDLPDEVKELYRKGYDLTGAYELVQEQRRAKGLEAELTKIRGNAAAVARSTGSMQGTPDGGNEEDDFVRGFRQGLKF